MNIFRIWTLALTLAASGCATVHQSSPPKTAIHAEEAVLASVDLPKTDFLPEQSAVAPATKYVFVQSAGGSILLGPMLGSLNIAANTKAMAAQYKNSLLAIDPTPIALDAMARVGIRRDAKAARFVAKSFVFIQHCYDDRFRLSLVFHVDSQSPDWVGRYTYHLPTSYAASQLASLSAEEITRYRGELAAGADDLTSLLQRDLAGDLPVTGKPVKFGSLYLLGNKRGGMGIYTMPEELFFPNAQIVEESETYVTVRLPGVMSATGVFGGLAFGVHRIDKALVHTLKPL